MTQSGQGEEPSARPAHEGIVLPSDGGEPLLPGMTGAPAPAPGAPTGGQAWGGSWGPERQQPQQDQEWPPAAAQQWGTPEQQQQPAAGPGPLPPEGAPAPSYGDQAYGQTPGYGQAPGYGQYDGAGGSAYGGNPQAPYGAAQQPGYGTPDAPQPGYGTPDAPQPGYGTPDAPQPGYGTPDAYQQYPGQPSAPLPPAYPAQGAPLPPADEGATQYIPPVPAAPADEGATQYIPPVAAPPADEGATQYMPPVPAAPADEGATQYMPPVTPGAMPAGHSDAEATQYIPPYGAQAHGGERQPPAEFDNLFRGGPGDQAPAGTTQQMPRVQPPNAHPGPAQPPYEPPLDGGRGRGGRSRVPLIAAVGVGIVVLGVGAGALLSGGGGDKGTDGETVAASSPVTQDSPSAAASADPAEQQAIALDKLLADSGSSRASVIQAVANVRRCDNLGQAATDLRNAAKQRNGLVTRLGQLSVDKLPANAELTAALTKAWQASAAADNHYAAWAGQVGGGKKGCHKGHARGTGETQAGDRESGTASAQKTRAAALWNTIAKKYGLTQRQPTQL
ncbi:MULTISPECIES: hypothetical protein [unclassified Streptomyces]|uniref:hypothetical protein n=1 Tax=unclassified Streptomyces TaxID=2593676 RepID=UPI00368E7D73